MKFKYRWWLCKRNVRYFRKYILKYRATGLCVCIMNSQTVLKKYVCMCKSMCIYYIFIQRRRREREWGKHKQLVHLEDESFLYFFGTCL